jgi:hypothetical protein
MQASSDSENKKLDDHLKPLEKRNLRKTKGVSLTITLFENAQCEALVEHGLATSVTALAKKALIKFIWENEDKIPEKLIPPKRKKGWKDKHPKKKKEG